MPIIVEVDWRRSWREDGLCADDIALALQLHFKNTHFTVTQLNAPTKPLDLKGPLRLVTWTFTHKGKKFFIDNREAIARKYPKQLPIPLFAYVLPSHLGKPLASIIPTPETQNEPPNLL